MRSRRTTRTCSPARATGSTSTARGTATSPTWPRAPPCPSSTRAAASTTPCEALAHCLALRERFGSLDGLSIAYVGPAGPLAYSLLQAAPIARFQLRLACPATAMADPWVLASAGQAGRIFDDPAGAVAGAHAVLRGDGPASNRTPTTQALLHALITGDWEV